MALWTPEYLDTSLWLDAADSATITESSGAVSQWADKSGHANHATASGTAQPTYTANVLNNSPAVVFDGLTDGLNVQHSETLNFASSEVSVFYVLKSSTNNNRVFQKKDNDTGASAPDSFFASEATVFGVARAYNVFTATTQNAGLMQCGIYDGAVVCCYRHGTKLIATAPNNATISSGCFDPTYHYADNSDPLRMGYRVYTTPARINAAFAELVFLPIAVATAERQKLEGYLAHKWGLSANLPSDHPYKSAAPIVPAIFGTITDRFGQPCQRKVYAASRPTDATAPQIIAHGLSDPVTGAYELLIPSEEEVTRVVVSEDDDPLMNDIVHRVIPA